MLQATHSALTAKILEYQTERARDGTRFWQCRGCMYGRVRMKQRPLYVRGESAGLWGLAWENWGPADLPTQYSCFCLLLLPAPQVCSIHIQQRCVWEREKEREKSCANLICYMPVHCSISLMQLHMWTRILWITYTKHKSTHTHRWRHIRNHYRAQNTEEQSPLSRRVMSTIITTPCWWQIEQNHQLCNIQQDGKKLRPRIRYR